MKAWNVDYQRLNNLASGYRGAQALFAAVRLDLFATLGRRALVAVALARELDANLRGVRMLCDALVSLKILRKRGAAYRNAPVAQTYLVPDSPLSQHALMLHGAALYERWSQLSDVIRTGRPAEDSRLRSRWRSTEKRFARAMAASGALAARETAGQLGLHAVRRLLDIGGGPGVYAIACARRNPRLEVVVFDGARTLEIARENIARAGLQRRITTRCGDALADDLGRGYDLVLLSNVIHAYSAEQNRGLIRRAAGALSPSGRLCVKDFLLRRNRTGPSRVSLFALNMLVNTAGGDCYTLAEIKSWLPQAGLTFDRAVQLKPSSWLVFARRRRSSPSVMSC